MNFKYFLIFILSLFLVLPAFSQNKVEKKDSVDVYKKIESYSMKSKFTKDLHKLIFKSSNKKKKNSTTNIELQDYKDYHGKIIRKVIIETLDPFGFSIEDTTRHAKNWLENLGNRAHVKSNNIAIKNLLLFKKNSTLDTLLITESKRLMRTQKFIRSVKIDIANINTESDSVDIKVRVLDSWSITPKGSISTSKFNFILNERNFLGFGHEFNNQLTNRFEDGKSAYSFKYMIPTIKNSYINTTLYYQKNLDDFYQKSINIERNFISPLTKWAGGIYLEDRFMQDSLPNDLNEYDIQNFKYTTQDIWLGHAFNIFKNNAFESRTTNLIASLRLANSNYKEKPNETYDEINYFADELFYLASIGVVSRQFIEDTYIFRDGIIEDVPIGFASSITSGIQRKNHNDRWYLGGQISMAKYTKHGYINAALEIGSFFNNNKGEQSALSLELNYFTNFISLGDHWKMRQFVKPQLLLGFNRLNSLADRLNLNDERSYLGYNRNEFRGNERSGIPGFNGENYGTKKVSLSLQTQFYSPWNIIGFRLNPYINITSGLMADTTNPDYEKKLYTSLGAGFIIRNDYLVFSSFQISFSYYPVIPGQGYNVFKTNSFETDNFGIQDIKVGKPTTVWYQ